MMRGGKIEKLVFQGKEFPVSTKLNKTKAWESLKVIGLIRGRKNWPNLWRYLWEQVLFGKKEVTE